MEPLCSTVHSTRVPGKSTQSNASATGITFTHDNLETAHTALVEQETDDGMAMMLLGKPTVALPPALAKEGIETTESELDPTTANNAINVYRNGLATDMVVSTFLGSAQDGSNTAWYLLVPQRAKLFHVVRQAPRLEQDTDIKSKVTTFTVDARWADCALDWRRFWGSKGDGATYSS